MFAKAAFWSSTAAAAWTLMGYPLWLALRPGQPWRRGENGLTASVIVPAYRERDALAEKLVALGDPAADDAIAEVIVIVDDDEETLRVAQDAAPWARFIYQPTRGGKLAALMKGASAARGDVLVLTDANNIVSPRAIRAALDSFADPNIVGVTGQRYEPGSPYERYEALVRRLESRSGSVAAVSGEIFLVRADRFPTNPGDPLPVNEDLWLLCRLVADGGRVVFEPHARSDEEPAELHGELERRTRMMAGLVSQIGELERVPPRFAARLASHKFARLALPGHMVLMLLASAALRHRSPYRQILGVQALGLALALVSLAAPNAPEPLGTPLRATRQFVLGNISTVRGLLRAARSRQSTVWEAVR